jgi:Domain of unknown function (DUF1942)
MGSDGFGASGVRIGDTNHPEHPRGICVSHQLSGDVATFESRRYFARATLAQGQTSTGKVYFDVTGDDPMAVVYTTGGPKPAMMWCCDGDMMRPMDDMMGMDMPMSMDMGDCPHCANMQP